MLAFQIWRNRPSRTNSGRYLKKKSTDQAVSLYCYLRDNGERWESEWREDFIRIFPSASDALPQIANEDLWQSEVFELIEMGGVKEMKDFVSRIGILEGTIYDPKEIYKEGRELGFTDRAEYIPFSIYPIEVENEHGLIPHSVFQRERKGRSSDVFRVCCWRAWSGVSSSLCFRKNRKRLTGRYSKPRGMLLSLFEL